MITNKIFIELVAIEFKAQYSLVWNNNKLETSVNTVIKLVYDQSILKGFTLYGRSQWAIKYSGKTIKEKEVEFQC